MKEINMKTYNEGDLLDYNDVLRFSPSGLDGPPDPYRCPVSTPAGHRRSTKRNNSNSYVTYTNLNRSMHIPKSSSALPKHSTARYLNKRRTATNAQAKNFDCYYVNKIKSEAHIDSQSDPSTWLNSLCSQPVDEIFFKYKRRSEAVDTGRNTGKTRNVSTPGEKALVTAWSSNTSQRGTHSSLSRATTKTMFSSNSKTSKQSVYDNTRFYGLDGESDRYTTASAPIFALMPVPPSTPQGDPLFVSPRESYSVSPEHVKFVKNESNQNLVHESSVLFDSSMYEPYQRDRRFPDIKVRKRSVSPTRKRVSSEPGGKVRQSPSVTTRPDLEESAIHVISIGQMFENKETPVSKPLHRSCSYRLPKTMSTSLPELQGRSLSNLAT